MNDQNRHTDDLKMIRKMMEESSRFLSLSGISGVAVGLVAIIGALVAWLFIINGSETGGYNLIPEDASSSTKLLLLLDGIAIIVIAIGAAFFMAKRESRKKNVRLWGPATRQLLISLFIPLVAGALFIFLLVTNNNPEYIVPAMLIFYGLALVNGGKFTFGEVQYLGALEIITGFLAGLFPGNGFIFWIVGFGFLHVLYGIILHRKYN